MEFLRKLYYVLHWLQIFFNDKSTVPKTFFDQAKWIFEVRKIWGLPIIMSPISLKYVEYRIISLFQVQKILFRNVLCFFIIQFHFFEFRYSQFIKYICGKGWVCQLNHPLKFIKLIITSFSFFDSRNFHGKTNYKLTDSLVTFQSKVSANREVGSSHQNKNVPIKVVSKSK